MTVKVRSVGLLGVKDSKIVIGNAEPTGCLENIHALVDEVDYDRCDDLNHWRISRKLES